jgi:tetratricopeptide (TPR) repeat protein
MWGFLGPACSAQSTAIPASLEAIELKIHDALNGGKYVQADLLYLQALKLSSGSPTIKVDLLCHLASNRILHLKSEQADSFANEAVQLVKTSRANHSYDPEMGVSANDLVTAYYSHGERSKDRNEQYFCAQRYLLISFLLKDDFDTVLLQRSSVIIRGLDYSAKYDTAIPLLKLMLAYLQRTKPTALRQISDTYFSLGVNYLGANQPREAGFAFFNCLNTDKKMGTKNGIHLIYLERYGAVMKVQENKLAEAESLIKIYLGNHRKFVGPDTECVAEDYYFYGVILEKEKNFAAAKKYYRNSLDIFDKLAKNLANANDKASTTLAGKLLTAEALVRLDRKGFDVDSLRQRAKTIHSKIPEWSKQSLDGSTFFILWDHLPYPMSAIPAVTETVY